MKKILSLVVFYVSIFNVVSAQEASDNAVESYVPAEEAYVLHYKKSSVWKLYVAIFSSFCVGF